MEEYNYEQTLDYKLKQILDNGYSLLYQNPNYRIWKSSIYDELLAEGLTLDRCILNYYERIYKAERAKKKAEQDLRKKKREQKALEDAKKHVLELIQEHGLEYVQKTLSENKNG